MNYATVCSGIEAPTQAWHSLGWVPQFFSDIEPFPSAVLAHHYPNVPNYGDMTNYKDWPDHDLGLICGGTPCQAFSVAGLRKGLDDPRGNLTLTYLAIVDRYRPQWMVWENVPGVLSIDKGRVFGAFLGGLGQLGYGFAYRVLDAQYFGVAQRRRRVFVVGYLGDWHRAAAVLFERHSLSGHPAPRREARKDTADGVARRTGSGKPTIPCLMANAGTKLWLGDQEALKGDYHILEPVTHSLRGEGFDASEDGTGRGTPLIPVPFDTTQITSAANYSSPKPGDPCHPLAAGAHAPAIAFTQNQRDEVRQLNVAGCLSSETGMKQQTYIAFSSKDHGADAMADLSPTLRAGGHSESHANAGVPPAVAFNWQNGGGYGNANDGLGITEEGTGPLQTAQHPAVATTAVRRLTPRECERLQGFPDDFTQIPWRNKPAEQCPDGPRYKALGNSMAVPVMKWIGERIKLLEDIFPKVDKDQ